jgi:DNA processing protein
MRVSEKISYGLASSGLTVVSGMARGIDSASHRGALKAKGRTIAVLGSGIDVIYPPENMGLMEKIAGSGAVISEFPMGTKPDKNNFPRRNRIISAMSLGVIVVEAAVDSGSLITVGYALEHGKGIRGAGQYNISGF